MTVDSAQVQAYNMDTVQVGELARQPPPFDWQVYLEMRLRTLQTELNWIRKQLGYQPKRCPHCGELIK